jgi:hypothetical protein
MSLNKNQSSRTIGLLANVGYPVDIDGDMFHILEAASDVTITFDESNRFTNLRGGAGANFGGNYSRVVITSVAAQSIVIVLGYGDFTNSRATFSGNITTSFETPNSSPVNNDVSLPAGQTTQIAPANNNRKKMIIFSDVDNVDILRVGCNSAVSATQGGIIDLGGNGDIETRTGVWIYNPSSATQKVNIIELEQV